MALGFFDGAILEGRFKRGIRQNSLNGRRDGKKKSHEARFFQRPGFSLTSRSRSFIKKDIDPVEKYLDNLNGMDVWKRGEKPPLPRSREGNESPKSH